MTVHDRSNGIQPEHFCGGVQLFIDLSKAFDTVDRNRLFSILRDCGASDQIHSLLVALHSESSYHLQNMTEFTPVMTTKGVRQGCKAAPTLWACFMQGFLQEAANKLGHQWVIDNITLFADDFHVGATFHSVQELWNILHNFGVLLDLLEEFGLHVNISKSHVILDMAGSNARKIQHQFVSRSAQGSFVQVPRQNGHSSFQLTASTTYLGVKIAYRQFEFLTVQHRVALGRAAFRRLRTWLTSKSLRVAQRIQLWRSCVQPIMTYGIFSVGLTSKCVQHLQAAMFQMLRNIIGDHAYLTRRTHQEALDFHQCATPLQLLLQSALTLVKSASQRHPNLAPNDVLQSLKWNHLEDAVHFIQDELRLGSQTHIDPDPLTTPDSRPAYACRHCDFVTRELPNLRRHYTNVHNELQLRTHLGDFHKFAVDGLPQCAWCMRKFTSWRAFKHHVERRACQDTLPFDSNQAWDHPPIFPNADLMPSGMPPATVPDNLVNQDDQVLRVRLCPCDLAHLNSKAEGALILDAVNSLDWNMLQQDSAACQLLTKHCAICGVYAGQCRELIAHLKLYHFDLMPNTLSKCAQLTLQHARISPCVYCKKQFKTEHICPVLLQASLLLVNGGGFDRIAGMRCVNRVLTCDICDSTFTTLDEVNSHVRTEHRLVQHDWNPSRDAIHGTSKCAHCQGDHVTMNALRRHVTFGHCSQFNANRTAETLALNAVTIQALQDGVPMTLMTAAADRMGLTLGCLNCGESYTRSSDLAAHLQLCHGHLWQKSAPFVNLLTDHLMRRHGCLCNPSTTVTLTAHVCVGFRQLAMQWVRQSSPLPLLVPYPLDPDHIQKLIHDLVAFETRQQILTFLHNRQFSALWMDDAMRATLRNQCLLCGVTLHAADLCPHLHQDHECGKGLTVHYLAQLTKSHGDSVAESPKCPACNLTYFAPLEMDPFAQETAAKAHIQGLCPVAAQISILAACCSDDNANHGPGCPDAAGGHFSESGRSLPSTEWHDGRPDDRSKASERSAAPKRPAPKKTSRPSSRGSHRSRSRHCPHGSGDHQNGQGSERLAKARFLCLFPDKGSLRSTAPADATSPELAQDAKRGQAEASNPASAPFPSSPHVPGASDEGLEDPQGGCSRPHSSCCGEAGPTARGWQLAVSEVECDQKEHGDIGSEALECNKDGTMLPGSDRDHADGGCGRPVPFSTPPTGDGSSSSLAPQAGLASLRGTHSDADPGGKQRLASAGMQYEAALPAAVQSLSTPQADGASQGQGQGKASSASMNTGTNFTSELQLRLALSIFQKDQNWCYANSALITLLWASLCRDTFAVGDWGFIQPF